MDNSVEEVLAKSAKARLRMQNRAAKLNEQLEDLKLKVREPATRGAGGSYSMALEIDNVATSIGKLEERIAIEAALVQRLQDLKLRQYRLQDSNFESSTPSRVTGQGLPINPADRITVKGRKVEAIQEQLRKTIVETGKQGKQARRLQKSLSKIQRNIARADAQNDIRDVAAGITDAISKDRSPGGFHVDEALQTSRFFKRRQLNLKGLRHKEKWDRFLNTDSSLNKEIYTQAVGRQLQMRSKYVPFLKEEGLLKDGDYDVYQGLSTYLRTGFDDDRRIAQKTLKGKAREAELKELADDFMEADEFLKDAFGEFTRSSYLQHANDNADRLVSIAQSGASATMLGKVLLSSFTDVAILAFAGSRFGTGFLDLFRQLRNKNILQSIEQDDEVLAMVLRNERVMSNTMMTSRVDLDAPSFEVPGGMLAKIQRTSNSVAQVAMWTNLLNVWNRMVRSSFGVGFMRQISKDLDGYSTLPTDLKGFYAKHGIGSDEARRMAEMYKKHSKTVNGIRIPNLQKWAEEGNDDLVNTFYRAVNGAGNEALLDPGLGDRPFLRSHPLGRLVLQFQSFTFTAGERWFAPMLQQGLIRPTDARFLFSGILGLAVATLANDARERLAGRESSLEKALEGDMQAAWEVFKNSWLRSPLSIGMQGAAMDNLGTLFAPLVNPAFQGLTGSQGELLNTEYLRYRQGQGLWSLAGPAPGLVLGTAPKILGDMVEGDVDSLKDTFLIRAPIINSLPMILMGKLGEQLSGE